MQAVDPVRLIYINNLVQFAKKSIRWSLKQQKVTEFFQGLEYNNVSMHLY